MSTEEVFERVKKIIVEQLGATEASVTMEASFIGDLGADPLDIVELVMAIEEELDLDVPLILYRPKNFSFRSYNVNVESGYALMEYYYGQEIVTLYINDYSDERKSGAYILDGQEIATVKMKNENINITIKKIQDKNDKKENYAACWEKDSVFYQISGKMQQNEFMNLVKNIKF